MYRLINYSLDIISEEDESRNTLNTMISSIYITLSLGKSTHTRSGQPVILICPSSSADSTRLLYSFPYAGERKSL